MPSTAFIETVGSRRQRPGGTREFGLQLDARVRVWELLLFVSV